ncbi:hypothetical protein J2T56_002857 [Natronobacillus azotifigens]
MKYVYWLLLSMFVLWEIHALQDIFGFSVRWQYLANVVFVIYFAYLFNINFPASKLLRLLSVNKRAA